MVARKLPSRICLRGKLKKYQFGEYGHRAYLGKYNVNIAKMSFSILTAKLGDKLVLDHLHETSIIISSPLSSVSVRLGQLQLTETEYNNSMCVLSYEQSYSFSLERKQN